MSRLLCTVLSLTALSSAGCEPAPTSELLRITFGSGEFAPPVEADTLCANGGCDGFEQLEAQLEFDSDGAFISGDAYVEIAQYRVDYDLAGVDDEDQPPYYANETSVLCDVDETVTFNVLTVGQVQREFVRSRFGTQAIDGTGTLTLAGYDHRNAIVQVEASFAISFADFVDDGGAP